MDLFNYQLTDLSAEESLALGAYKTASDDDAGQSRCFELNRQLEHGLFPDEMGTLGMVVRALDSVFDRCPKLTDPLTVYRAIGLRSHYPLAIQGQRFRNLSYWSTSIHRETAEGFLKAEFQGAPGALLELHLPAALAVYNMETLPGAGGHEGELLLPRGILWEVGAFNTYAMTRLLPHVRAKFSNVFEVTLTAGPAWRAR